MDFYDRVLLLRKQRNLKQTEVAKAVSITVRQYQRYEARDTQPTLAVLISLSQYFNVSLDYLCGLSDAPERR